MPTPLESLWKFKFQFGNAQGQATSIFSKKGSFDGEQLTLDQRTYAVSDIAAIERRQKLVVMAVAADNQLHTLILVFGSQKLSQEFKERLDVARSGFWARQHRADLEKRGQVQDYRDAACPNCQATIILSHMPASPQLYCPFCETLMTLNDNGQSPANERVFRLCDDCGLFSQPQKYTIMYIWFIVVAYGWSMREKWCCRTCIRKEAWKMFWGNLLFVLGLPFAVIQLFRAYSGDWLGGSFRGLDTGNARIIKGDAAAALPYYRAILERVPYAAGVKYNLAKGLLHQDEPGHAAKMLEAALHDCTNYAPAATLLRHLYQELGEQQKLKELDAIWSIAEQQTEDLDVEETSVSDE